MAQTLQLALTLACLKFLNYCLYTLIVPFMPLILSNGGLDPAWIGYIFAAYPIATISFTPLVGYCMPKMGRKCALLIGSITSLLGCLLFLSLDMNLTSSMLVVISMTARIIQGAANALT